MTSPRRLLLGDIGGTHARFLLVAETGPIAATPQVFHTADHESLEAALRTFLGPLPVSLAGAAFSVAGPVRAGVVQMTNHPWRVSAAALGAALGLSGVVLINDFEALARGVPQLTAADLRSLGTGDILAAKGPIGVIGPGTGLGVSGLLPDGRGGFVALSGEGGHVDLAPANDRESAIVGHLLKTHGHVSAERIVSGSGLERLYVALAEIDGQVPLALSAAEIDARARGGADRRARETIALFTSFLAGVAGNLALTLGATGGIYLGGGILPRWGDLLDAALFRRRFEAKGRLSAYLAAIPTALITAPDIAFRGLRQLALAQRP